MSKFLLPVKKVFPLPKTAEGNEDKFFEAYFQVLKTFDDVTLAGGAEHIIATRLQRTFPLPAECNMACAEAVKGEAIRSRSEAAQGNRHEHLPFEQRYPEWQERRVKRANELVCSEMGRDAMKEKWIASLHDFCRDQQRLPDKYEVADVRASGMKTQKEFEELVSVDVDKRSFNPLVANLINLRRAMFDRLGKAVSGEFNG